MKNIFFSWQSDLDSKTHRNYIERCIKNSIRSLNKEEELNVFLEYDRDTIGLHGSPDISLTIFNKIDKCSLYIADVSNIIQNQARLMPNPNVLLELGYAINVLGWEKIICFFDINTGSIEDLPFDIRQKRILAYNPTLENEDRRIVSILRSNILSLYSMGKLANPLIDYMKSKIDKCILNICKKLSNLLFETYSLSEGLSDTTKLLNLSKNEISEILGNVSFPAFVLFDSQETTDSDLRDILKNLFSSNYFHKEWSITVLRIIDWLRIHQNIVSPRDIDKFIIYSGSTCSNNYAVISAHTMNPSNLLSSKIVLETFIKDDNKKYIDTIKGRVVNTLEYTTLEPKKLEKIYTISKNKIEYLSNHIFNFIELCNNWLDLTDSEFILDPDIYKIEKF